MKMYLCITSLQICEHMVSSAMQVLIHRCRVLWGIPQSQRVTLQVLFGLGGIVWGSIIAGMKLELREDRVADEASLFQGIPFKQQTEENAVAWRLASIILRGTQREACINNCWLRVGDRLQEIEAGGTQAEVVSIDFNRVVLQRGNARTVLKIRDQSDRWETIEVTR